MQWRQWHRGWESGGLLNFGLSKNFLLVGKIWSKNAKVGAETLPYFG